VNALGDPDSRQNYVSPRNLVRLLAGYHCRPDSDRAVQDKIVALLAAYTRKR